MKEENILNQRELDRKMRQSLNSEAVIKTHIQKERDNSLKQRQQIEKIAQQVQQQESLI